MHYLSGKPVFISSDGLLRDAGASHGRIADRGLFCRAQAILAEAIAVMEPRSVLACFDTPVPFSADHARTFETELRSRGMEARSLVERSADLPLKLAEAGSAVATADSAVVDALIARVSGGADALSTGRTVVLDAARLAIERAFGPRDWLDFSSLLS
jgi:hypothetical protein